MNITPNQVVASLSVVKTLLEKQWSIGTVFSLNRASRVLTDAATLFEQENLKLRPAEWDEYVKGFVEIANTYGAKNVMGFNMLQDPYVKLDLTINPDEGYRSLMEYSKTNESTLNAMVTYLNTAYKNGEEQIEIELRPLSIQTLGKDFSITAEQFEALRPILLETDEQLEQFFG